MSSVLLLLLLLLLLPVLAQRCCCPPESDIKPAAVRNSPSVDSSPIEAFQQ
jgi:hypothetical protein